MSRGARRWSIYQKLMGVTALVTTSSILFLSLYLASAQVDRLRTSQTERATMYGTLLSNQLRSAVAFHDRETAREVLSSLANDPEVVATELHVKGTTLFSYGHSDVWTGHLDDLATATVFQTDDSVAIATPVASLEGPTGTLVIQLSMTRVHAATRAVYLSAIGIGLVAIVLKLAIMSWLIGGLRRRLGAMGAVAAAVTRGDLDQTIGDPRTDEIGALAQAFDAMVAQVRNVQAGLETRVAERTAQLQEEVQLRARAELELRQAQKLESVGRLASGVAHEINTPIQFVSDSVHFLGTALAELDTVIEQHHAVTTALRETPDEVARLADAASGYEAEVDLEFLRASIPDALARAKDGISRVITIVRSMKEFAHPDTTGFSEADLGSAIESTLVIARNEYKYVADLVVDIGALPNVQCHVSEINQVILNLVVNAAHAIDDRIAGTDDRGEIRVVARADADAGTIEISISDTGGGIPDAIRERVFDPFFTTKDVGRGSGQGLAIARSVVVDKHAGKLWFDTEIGRGTTFHIVLPIRQHVADDRIAA